MLKLISELTLNKLEEYEKRAEREIELILAKPPVTDMESLDFLPGFNDAGFFADARVDGELGIYVVHLVDEQAQGLNRTYEKVKGYAVAKQTLEMLPEDMRTITYPRVVGHRPIGIDKDGLPVRRAYVVDFIEESRPKDKQDYANHLGINVVRFMYCGLCNVARHLIPIEQQTAMIDLDQFDPGVFYWNFKDDSPLNMERRAETEKYFIKDVLHSDLLENDKRLMAAFQEGVHNEVKHIKGNSFYLR